MSKDNNKDKADTTADISGDPSQDQGSTSTALVEGGGDQTMAPAASVADANASIVDQALETGGIDLRQLPIEMQVEMAKDIIATEAELEANALPKLNSKDILNRKINILDASFRSIPDKDAPGGQKACVSFVCEFAEGDAQEGEQFTVLKSSNTFNDVFVQRFDRMRGIIQRPLNGYQFIESEKYGKAGNQAHILVRANSQLAAAK